MHCILEQNFFSGPKTEIKDMDQFLNYHKNSFICAYKNTPLNHLARGIFVA